MSKTNMLNRMSRGDKSKKQARKQMMKRGKRDDSDGEESDSSVDSSGNIRDLIDYEDEEDEDEEEPSHRPVRKASVVARKKITKIMKQDEEKKRLEKENARLKEEISKEKSNTIHYPAVKRKPVQETPKVSRKAPRSVEEDIEETEDDEEEEDEEEDEEDAAAAFVVVTAALPAPSIAGSGGRSARLNVSERPPVTPQSPSMSRSSSSRSL